MVLFLVADESILWMIVMSRNTVKRMPLYARLHHNTLVHALETGYESYTLQKHFFALLPNKFFVCLIARVQKELRVPTCAESDFQTSIFHLVPALLRNAEIPRLTTGEMENTAIWQAREGKQTCVCVCVFAEV